IARRILLREFSDIEMQQSFQRFHADLTAYFATYGSWKNAQQLEPFPAFEQRRRNLFGSAMPKRFRSPDIENPDSLPANQQPPFPFALADPDGRIIMGNRTLKAGTIVPENLRKAAMPIMLDGKVMALALPSTQRNLNNLDISYLKAMR